MSDDVRDQIAAALFAAKQEYDGDFYVVAWEHNTARDKWYALADALLPIVKAAEERGRAEVAARVRAALNGALMVPQAEIRRALEESA